MKTLDQIDAAIAEAEMIRAQHDGVHLIHTYVCVLSVCRELAEHGEWSDSTEAAFDEAMARARFINRTGFAPKLPLADYRGRRVGWDIGD